MQMILPTVLGCLASLCLQTAARAVTAIPPTQSETFTGTYTPVLAQSDGALLYGANLPAAYGGQFVTREQSLFTTAPAATASVFTETVAVPVGATNLRASVFSVYDATNGFVTLALDNTVAASILGQNFNAVFTTANYNDEATLATAITGGNVSYLEGFFDTYLSDFPTIAPGDNTASGTLVNFSAATNGGTATLSFVPAPEPSTWALLGLGAVGASIVAVRRRRVTV